MENTTTPISWDSFIAAYMRCQDEDQRQKALGAGLAVLNRSAAGQNSGGGSPVEAGSPEPAPIPPKPAVPLGVGSEFTEEPRCLNNIPLALEIPPAGEACPFSGLPRTTTYKLAQKGVLLRLPTKGVNKSSIYGPSICELKFGGCKCGHRHALERLRRQWHAEHQQKAALKSALEKEGCK